MKEEIMKKLISLAIAMFFATAAFAEGYAASDKITQKVLSGQLKQTVMLGDEIETTKISYENIKGKLKSDGFAALGLSETWTNNVCEISGRIKRNLNPKTITPYILVEDDEGKVAQTQFEFILQARPTTLKIIKGETTQSVKAGESISEIEIEYSGIKSFIFGSSPSGVKYERDGENQIIKISGKIDANTASGEYKYIVRGVKQDNEKDTLKVEITFNVTGAPVSVSVAENATQKVVAGEAIKPVSFSFTGANNYQLTKIPPGKFSASKDGENMIIKVSGDINEKAEDGTYTIELEVSDGKETAKAQATVEVVHKAVVTKIETIENATQTVTAGDSIEPIVFKFENVTKFGGLAGFPGGFSVSTDNTKNTVTIFGLLDEDTKGSYTVTYTVSGTDNEATAEATINVTPVTMKFDLVEGSDNQTVVAGKDIVPIVYQYDHVKSVKGSGFPSNLKMEQDPEKKQVKIFGTVNSASAAKEYVYTIELMDIYSEKSTVTGKINVVLASSSSSEATSSSSEKVDSSSSKETSSSSATSSSSETTKSESSSSEKTVSSSSEKTGSSSSKGTSSSSETTKPTSSSSEKGKSSSSTTESSSSSEKGKSSSSEKSSIIASVKPGFEFGYANNELMIVLPKPAMLRVQVFDMMGHMVESFAETETSSKSFNLAHLAKGNYVVRMESARYARNAKIFVK